MILLFTDFGFDGPYVGQMKTALYQADIGTRPVLDLMHDAPRFQPRAAGCLLAALLPRVPVNAVLLAVVDPGVGSDRRGAVLKVDGRWLVGPDNSLFETAARAAVELQWWDIEWPLAGVSATFHGRDVFAPVAAMLARGEAPAGIPVDPVSRLGVDTLNDAGRPGELAEVIYLDSYGNAFTGLRAEPLAVGAAGRRRLRVGGGGSGSATGCMLAQARTFSDVPLGQAFWYCNSLGLVEVAVNCGDAAAELDLAIGTPVAWASAD